MNQEEEEEDKIDWKVEASGIIKDISSHVIQFVISDKLQTPEEGVYLNLETLEKQKFTIKLNYFGFAIVGKDFDDNTLEDKKGGAGATTQFETIYSLLQSISPKYISNFAGNLIEKLSALNNSQTTTD